MSIVTRKFSACPVRTASQTWEAIMAVIAYDENVKRDLSVISGIASSIISEGTPKSDPITIVGTGSRLRIYCLYEEDGSTEDANESPLTWKLFEGEWKIYLPVQKEDLTWITRELKSKGSKFKPYEAGTKIDIEEETSTEVGQLTINIEKLKSNG